MFMLVTTLLQFSIELDARSREYGRTKTDDWFGVLIADMIDLMYNDVTRLDGTDCWSSRASRLVTSLCIRSIATVSSANKTQRQSRRDHQLNRILLQEKGIVEWQTKNYYSCSVSVIFFKVYTYMKGKYVSIRPRFLGQDNFIFHSKKNMSNARACMIRIMYTSIYRYFQSYHHQPMFWWHIHQKSNFSNS